MPSSPVTKVVEHLRNTVLWQEQDHLPDGQLLDRFVETRDHAAFAALVRRHGPMVWGVCLRIVGHADDAEDAFQATFLILVRKAAAIKPREAVGNWLYGVAAHAALKARTASARVRSKEKQVTSMPDPAKDPRDDREELQRLLDQELGALPDKYRLPVVLCDLEGRTRKEVAAQLKIPEGTVSSRLTTAHQMLAKRLARHGLAVSGASLAGLLAQNAASASVPAAVVSSTIETAAFVAAGNGVVASVVSTKVAALTEGVLKSMLLTKLKTTALVLLMFAMAAFTCGVLAFGMANGKGDDVEKLAAKANEKPKDVAKERTPEPAWGDAVDGVRFGISLSNAKARFALGEEIQFAFHAQNKNSNAVKLAPFAMLYYNYEGANWPLTDDFVPIFTNATGKTIVGVWNTNKKKSSGELALKAGETRELGSIGWHLDPLRLRGVDLKPGKYTVHFERLLVGKPSPTGKIDIEVVEPIKDNLPANKTAWGQAVEGIEYGLELKDKRNTYPVGDTATFVLKARNVAGKRASFEYGVNLETPSIIFGVPHPKVIDAAGKEVRVIQVRQWGANENTRTVTLSAGQVVVVSEYRFVIGRAESAYIDAGPGTYRVRYDSFYPYERKKQPTGTLEIVVTEPADAPPAKPKKAAGLTARIVAPEEIASTAPVLKGELVLTNEGDAAVRVCTLCSEGPLFDFVFCPHQWKSDSPSLDMSAQRVVTLAPGKTVALPFQISRVHYKDHESLTIKASYFVDKDHNLCKKLDLWSGTAEAKPAVVKVFTPPEELNKDRLLFGVVKEIDGKSVLLSNVSSQRQRPVKPGPDVRVLLNEKTEFLRETGFDAAPAKLTDVTKGKFVYVQTKKQGETLVAIGVVLELIQDPPKADDNPKPLPGGNAALPELVKNCKGAVVATLQGVGDPEPGPPGAADYSSKWKVAKVLRGTYPETAHLSFRVQSLPTESRERPPAVGKTYILIAYEVNANQVAAILDADDKNFRKVQELLTMPPKADDKPKPVARPEPNP